MAELGIIASVAQIADVGLRLSIRLYTFGEIVASADRSVISISKDVSLTSGVLKELGQLLDKDRETQTFSENAVRTADGVVKECLEVFQEMENILVKKMPSLAKGEGRDGKSGERTKRAVVMLERLKWGYLQPKLQLLRSNLDRLKSTLLLMLNVITYARQVSAKTESPSVIAEQRSLIEDLAHSNQEYVRKFEELKLGIESMAVEDVDDAPNIGAMEGKPSTTTRSLPGAHTSKFGRTRFATGGLPLQDEESTRSLSSRDLATATRSSPNAQSNLTKSLATSPSAAVNNVFINTSIQTNIAMPPVQERGIPTTEAPIVFEQEVLFKQLEHYSMLIKNLLKEVDEAQYKITFKSRLRVKGGIAGLHESERQELERIWGVTALQSAEQRLESLVEGLGEMPMINRVAAGDPGDALPTGYMGIISALPITADLGLGDEEQEEAADRTPHPIPDLRLSQLNPGIGVSTVEGPSNMLVPINEAVAKGGRFLGVYEDKRLPTETTAGAYTRDYSVVDQQQRAPRFKSHHPQQLMLSKARVADPHKNQSNNGNRAPAAPVISYAPCSYRGQSPQGVPRFDGPTKNELTQEKLVLPAPKKRRASNNVTSPSVPAQAPTNLADLGLRAAAADAAAGYVNRNARKSEAQDRRSRSRTRRNSINAIRTFREADDAAQNSAYRDKKIAQAGLADAAVAGLVERARSKSRGGEKRNRSKSRIRQGLPVAATGLGSTAIAGLYEKIRAGKKDKEDNKAQYTEKDDATALDEHLSHSREERTAESEEKVGSNGDQLALQLQDTTDSLDGFFDESYSMPFNSDINNPDILENFDFERFLQTPDGGSNFDPSPFEAGDGIEIGDGPNIREPLKLEQSLRNIDPSQPESVEHVVIQPKAKPEGSIAGIEGLHVVEKGIVEDQERTDPKESDAYSSKHVQDHYHDANTVNPELLNHVQTHMTQSPDLARQGHWDPKKIIKGRQLYLKRPANRRDDQSTSTPDSPKFKRPTIPKMSPVSEKEVKETHHEKKVESMKGEYNKSTPSDSRVAVDEADLKKQAKASLMGSDDWNMSPSLGGMDLPAEPMDRPLEKKPLLPAKDIKSSRKELTGLPNQADLPATDSRPQLPPIQGLGLAIDIMPPQKDDSSVKGFRNRHGKKIDTAKEPVAVPEEVRSAQEDAAISGFRQRRTLRRVAACTTCRHEKVKCDRTRPQCVHCEQFGIECVYDDGKSLDQDAGSDVSSHTEKDLERPSQVPSRANSKRDSEQSTGDGAALALYWQIAPATSAAPMFSRHFRRNPGLLDSAAEANKEDPLPSPQIGKGLLSHRLADNYGRHKTGMPVSIPTPLPIHSAQKPFRPTFNRTDPATSRNFEQRLFACQMCGEYFARLFDLRRHVALRKEKESHAGEHDPGSVVDSNIKPGPDPDLSSHLDESLGAPSVMDASSPTHPPGTLSPSPSAFAKAKPRGTVRAADPATSIQDQHTDFGLVDSVSERERVEPWQHESEQGESRLADMEVADRLVLLWTTVKPL